MKQYLSVPEAAEYLSTSVRFIRRVVSERRLAFYKVGSHVRISVDDLENFVQYGRVEPIAATDDESDFKGVA